jgi:hypothetical protein
MTFCYQKLTCFHGGEEARRASCATTSRVAEVHPVPAAPLPPGTQRAHPRDPRSATSTRSRRSSSDSLARGLRANDVRSTASVHNALERARRLAERERGRGLPREARPRRAPSPRDRRAPARAEGRRQLLRDAGALAPSSRSCASSSWANARSTTASSRPALRTSASPIASCPTGWLDGEELRLRLRRDRRVRHARRSASTRSAW